MRSILHVVITTPEYPADASAALTQALRARFVHVDELIDPGPYRLRDLAAEHVYDQIICTVGGQLSFGTDTCRLTGAVARNMMEGWMRYDTPVVFVNFGHHIFKRNMWHRSTPLLTRTDTRHLLSKRLWIDCSVRDRKKMSEEKRFVTLSVTFHVLFKYLSHSADKIKP